MKYLIKTTLTLTIIFLLLKTLLFFFNSGHDISYSLGNFKIKENFTTQADTYYFELTHEDFKINFQINQNYRKAEKILKQIEYKEIDNYICLLPIFQNGKILSDVMCLKDKTITYAHNLENKNINEYLTSLEKYGYNKNNYKDTSEETKLSNTQSIYKQNLLENNYIAMETYKGLNLFNATNSNVQIFEEDVYTKPISIFAGKYYIVADYQENYTFKNFYVINIINGDIKKIRSYDEISFDSYIMGAIGQDIYLFDKEANTEYKISIEKETVKVFKNKDNLQTYNGTWQNITLNEALEETYFQNYYTKDIEGYDKVDKIGNYYYAYEKSENGYKVYRMDIQNKDLKTYLFETTDINSVIYLNDVIYYVNGNTLYYYKEIGSRKVITNKELQFNQDISFGVYKR